MVRGTTEGFEQGTRRRRCRIKYAQRELEQRMRGAELKQRIKRQPNAPAEKDTTKRTKRPKCMLRPCLSPLPQCETAVGLYSVWRFGTNCSMTELFHFIYYVFVFEFRPTPLSLSSGVGRTVTRRGRGHNDRHQKHGQRGMDGSALT